MIRFDFVIIVFVGFSGRLVESSDCKINADCQIEGAICTSGSCSCPPDFVANSIYTACLPVAHGFGASCSDNLQCSATLKSGGFCNNGTCDCEPGYHYLLGNCWMTAGLFDKCYTDENCFVDQDFDSSVCSSDKKCVCREGYYQREYSSCRLASYKPGDPCGISIDCKFPNAECLWNHTCSVVTSESLQHERKSSLIDRQDGTPVTIADVTKIGSQCKTSSDCPKYAECLSSGVCLCLPGYYTLDNVTCNPEIRANCSADSECIGRNLYCKNNQYCDCTEGHVVSVDRRYCDKLSRDLGWSCLRDGWCAYFGPNALCVNKSCTCSNSSHYVANQMYCWTTKKAGQSCQNELDCGLSGMSCNNGTCECRKGTHPSTNKEICRTDSTSVGQQCIETIDCMFPNSVCNVASQKCVCGPHYVQNGTSCVSGVGGPCNQTNTCSLPNSQCANNVCSCAKGFVSDVHGAACLPQQTTIGDACQDSNQCTLFDGVCTHGVCSCSTGSHFVEGWKCYKDVDLGGSCTQSGECVTAGATCLKYVCACAQGYRPNGLLCSGHPPTTTMPAILCSIVMAAIFLFIIN